MKFNSMRYNLENVFLREISQIAQLFGKLRNLRYLQDFLVINVFWCLKNVKAVCMFENGIK